VKGWGRRRRSGGGAEGVRGVVTEWGRGRRRGGSGDVVGAAATWLGRAEAVGWAVLGWWIGVRSLVAAAPAVKGPNVSGYVVQRDGEGAFETPDGAGAGCGRVVTRHEPGRRERTGGRGRCRCYLYDSFYSINLRRQAHVWSLLLPHPRRQCSERRSRRVRLNGTPAGKKRTRYWWQLQVQQTSMKRMFPTSQSM